MSAILLNIFHNVEGDNIHDFRRNFFKILHTIPQNASDIETTLSQLQPTNYLEQSFKTDILIHFHRTQELFEMLKSSPDEAFMCKVIKQPWFFKELFKLSHNNCEELINEVIPQYSYITRMKVLKGVCKILPQTEVDCLYDFILNRYGLDAAKAYLPFCSAAKIEKLIKERDLALPTRYLIQLFRKSPALLDTYIEEYMKHRKRSFNGDELLKIVAQEDLPFFCRIKEKYKLYTKLGRRVTKKLVQYKRQDIIENKHDYATIMRADRLVRCLKNDFKEFYFNIHTRSIQDKYYEKMYVKHFPKKYQFHLVQSTFQRVFNCDIISKLDWVDYALMENIQTELETRHKIAELKYKSTNEMDYVKFMDSKTALKIIKEKINVTANIANRTQLLKLMIDVAAVNKDFNVLEQVLKYYVERHRNEEMHNKETFIRHLYGKKELDLKKFNENIWNYLMQMLTLLKVQDYYGYPSLIFDAAAPYLDYLYKNNKPWKDELLRILDDVITKDRAYCVYIPFGIQCPEIKRLAILEGLERMKTKYETENFVRFACEALREIQKFNEAHPEFAINIFENPTIQEAIKLSFSEDYRFWYQQALTEAVFDIVLEKIFDKIERNPQEQELIKEAYNCGFKNKLKPLAPLAWELANKIDKTKTERKLNRLLWKNRHVEVYPQELSIFMSKYCPKLIVEYSSLFEEHYAYFFDRNFRYYNHILGELIRPYCEKIINEKRYPDLCIGLVKVYANLLTENEYRQLAEKFIPDYDKVDLLNKEQEQLYKFQCNIAECIKFFASIEMLPVLLEYCKGDFLPSCLAPLHKIYYHLPENLLPPNLKLLDKKAVSLRKHYPALSCKLLDRKSALEVLKEVAQHEDNKSCRKHLILNTFTFFTRNPSKEIFNFLISHLEFADKDDEETLNKLIDIQKLDVGYRAAYVAKLLNLLCIFDKADGAGDTSVYKNAILQKLGEQEMKDLSEDVCRKDIIEKYFLKPEYKDLATFVGKFVEKYLKFKALDSANETECFDFIYSIIRNEWKNKSRSCREMINIYFKNFHKDALEMDENTRYISLQTKYLLTIFNPVEFFQQYLLVRLLKIKNDFMESGEGEGQFLKVYAKQVREFAGEILAEFGLSVLAKVGTAIYESVPRVFQQLTSIFTFCLNILDDANGKVDTNAYLIVIMILEYNSKALTVEQKSICDKIFHLLRNNDEKIVQLHLNNLLSDKRKFEYLQN